MNTRSQLDASRGIVVRKLKPHAPPIITVFATLYHYLSIFLRSVASAKQDSPG
jgi:hypothetical protein